MRKLYGQPAIRLSEGMLSIFIRPDATRQVVYLRDVIEIQSNSSRSVKDGDIYPSPRSSVDAGYHIQRDANGLVLDLGSLRETMMIS